MKDTHGTALNYEGLLQGRLEGQGHLRELCSALCPRLGLFSWHLLTLFGSEKYDRCKNLPSFEVLQ